MRIFLSGGFFSGSGIYYKQKIVENKVTVNIAGENIAQIRKNIFEAFALNYELLYYLLGNLNEVFDEHLMRQELFFFQISIFLIKLN